MPPKKKKKKIGEQGNLLWTDDEVEFLLDTVRDFKEKKEHEAIDWESTKDKYERIKERFIEIFLTARKARIPT